MCRSCAALSHKNRSLSEFCKTLLRLALRSRRRRNVFSRMVDTSRGEVILWTGGRTTPCMTKRPSENHSGAYLAASTLGRTLAG